MSAIVTDEAYPFDNNIVDPPHPILQYHSVVYRDLSGSSQDRTLNLNRLFTEGDLFGEDDLFITVFKNLILIGVSKKRLIKTDKLLLLVRAELFPVIGQGPPGEFGKVKHLL